MNVLDLAFPLIRFWNCSETCSGFWQKTSSDILLHGLTLRSGTLWSVLLHNVPAWPRNRLAPFSASMVPCIAVQHFGSHAQPQRLKSFENWREIESWMLRCWGFPFPNLWDAHLTRSSQRPPFWATVRQSACIPPTIRSTVSEWSGVNDSTII